jgi:hypothetical protein
MFFTVFSGSSLVGCAIWQYENMREAARLANLKNFICYEVLRSRIIFMPLSFLSKNLDATPAAPLPNLFFISCPFKVSSKIAYP